MVFSRIISMLLHPVFIPLLTILLIINISQDLNGQIKQADCLSLLLMVTVVSSCLLPIFFVALLAKIGWVTNLYLPLRKERVIPLLFTAFSVYLGMLYLQSCLDYIPLLKSVFIALIINILLAMFVSFFWKISLHMMSIGGSLGIVISGCLLYELASGSMIRSVVVFCVLTCLLGFSRIKEKAHTAPQVILGFLTGFVVVFLFILFKNNICYLDFPI